MNLSRRGLIGGLLAAPFVSRIPGLLMPVKSLPEELEWSGFYTRVDMTELIKLTREAFFPRLVVQLYSVNPLIKLLQESERSLAS